jgi:hypothetical protein
VTKTQRAVAHSCVLRKQCTHAAACVERPCPSCTRAAISMCACTHRPRTARSDPERWGRDACSQPQQLPLSVPPRLNAAERAAVSRSRCQPHARAHCVAHFRGITPGHNLGQPTRHPQSCWHRPQPLAFTLWKPLTTHHATAHCTEAHTCWLLTRHLSCPSGSRHKASWGRLGCCPPCLPGLHSQSSTTHGLDNGLAG